jgi:hypothetical protein
MEWRSTRVGGNSFAKYATAGVFAPLIFTIPFPTFNQANAAQLLQVQSINTLTIAPHFSHLANLSIAKLPFL